mmetsp:Transcript_16841/g.28580  ORF Transcript_16841/g.28580 Transcript_16841/m.28580 type:complete len:328 (+) Transcript_16841:1162-2145(+)
MVDWKLVVSSPLMASFRMVMEVLTDRFLSHVKRSMTPKSGSVFLPSTKKRASGGTYVFFRYWHMSFSANLSSLSLALSRATSSMISLVAQSSTKAQWMVSFMAPSEPGLNHSPSFLRSTRCANWTKVGCCDSMRAIASLHMSLMASVDLSSAYHRSRRWGTLSRRKSVNKRSRRVSSDSTDMTASTTDGGSFLEGRSMGTSSSRLASVGISKSSDSQIRWSSGSQAFSKEILLVSIRFTLPLVVLGTLPFLRTTNFSTMTPCTDRMSCRTVSSLRGNSLVSSSDALTAFRNSRTTPTELSSYWKATVEPGRTISGHSCSSVLSRSVG